MSDIALLREAEKRFTLRMNADVFEQIARSAKEHRRSVAKEIEEAVAFYLKYTECTE